MAPAPFPVATPDDYLPALRAAYVLADVDERRASILEGLRAKADEVGARLVDDDELLKFDALLSEVTHLVEWPVAQRGTFAVHVGLADREGIDDRLGGGGQERVVAWRW
jgi:glycyl-tRNA synthetase beta chain